MKKMILFAAGYIFLMACNNEKKEDKDAGTKPVTENKSAQCEITDARYMDIGKSFLNSLASGDMAAWSAAYTDSAKYYWNNGDSLVGKPAIVDYWTKRRHDVIDSLTFTEQVFIPVKVNTSQQHEMTGIWLLSWYKVWAKYKTGKSMGQWMHMLMHFNSADKMDQVVQYVDRVPINAATQK